MKKIMLTLAMAMVCATSFAFPKEKLYGTWRCDNIQIEIQDSIMCIDDLDIEGDVYRYTFNDTTNVITALDMFGYPLLISCNIKDNTLIIQYLDVDGAENEKIPFKKVKK